MLPLVGLTFSLCYLLWSRPQLLSSLQANGTALDHPAFAAVAGVSCALERAHVLLVRRWGEVVHHTASERKTKQKVP